MRTVTKVLVMAAALIGPGGGHAQTDIDLGKITERSAPGLEHAALDLLAGTWSVEKSVYQALGTPDEPARSSAMTTVRDWVAGGHFLRDTTTGTIGGNPYERIGFLGYNPMDRRYEWNTADNVTTIMMTYHGDEGSEAARPIDMTGVFTDPGVTGEANVGEPVAMRTRITITDENHHTFEIFFTPPGGAEILADRMEFTRTD